MKSLIIGLLLTTTLANAQDIPSVDDLMDDDCHIFDCTVTEQAGEVTPACQNSPSGPIQCYAVLEGIPSNSYGNECVQDELECAADTGAHKVDPCVVVDDQSDDQSGEENGSPK